MAPSTRKKLLIAGGGLLGLLIVALLAAPLFINANSYKPVIVAAVKKATGRELALDGPITASLLPTPRATVAGVRFFNAPGSKNPNMVEVKSVTVTLSLAALLVGSLEVSEVSLLEPKIVLEINSEGKPNWEFTPSVAEAKPVAAKPGGPRPFSVGRLAIVNGTLIFSDSKAGLSVEAEKASFNASVGSIDGPYSLAGSAVVDGAPLRVDLSVGAKGPSGHSAELFLEAGGGKLSFKGSLSELGPNARLVGMLSSSADNLIAFADTLVKIGGQPQPSLPPLLAGKFTFDGSVDLSQTAVSASDFKLALGDDSGSGSLLLTLKPALAIEGKLAAPRLDLDRWLAVVARPAAAQSQPPPAGSSAAPAPPPGPSLLAGLTAKLTLEVGEVIYNKQPVRNVALELQARGGAVAIPKLSATLPGDMVLQANSTLSGDAARPVVSGEFSLAGPKLRETLSWLDVDVSAVPPAKLTRLSLKGRMASSGGNVQVSDAVFELDDLKGGGGIAVTFGVPLSIVMNLELAVLDLDSFLLPGASKPASAPAAAAPTASAAAVAGPSIGLKVKVARLIWRKETIGGVEIDVARRGDTLRLNDIKISNLVGARLAVRGSITDLSSTRPHPDIAFNFEAPDLDRVLKLVGTTAPAGLGAVAASGGVAGSLEQLSLRELTVNGMGQHLQATGTLALPGAAQGSPKSAAYRGSLALNGQTIEGTIDAALSGRPHVTADLRASSLDLDRIGGTAAPARPASRGQPAAASRPIDTGPLRAIDGSFRLAVGTLVSPPLRIGNADLAATLKDGVLTVSHFKGALYGGSLALSGVVNGSQPVLGLDIKGDASGLGLGEMLRSTSGTNQFGGRIKVTVDGRLNASGIAIRSSGSTASQLQASMAGGAQLSGHIYAGADRALQVLGSAATGVVGGVLDNTLGNVLDIFGQGGRVSPTNILNAASLVLNRFVNRDNPLSGHVDIAGGMLTDKSLVIEGNRATAHVATRTSLVNSTTDTTVSITIAEDSSAPYLVVTARGPLSSPSLSLTRGTAKDPPGMVNTLPGVGALLPGQSSGSQQTPSRSPLVPNIPIPGVPNLFGR
jgi:uncharacterized protein involved in outer membrane biogenesis